MLKIRTEIVVALMRTNSEKKDEFLVGIFLFDFRTQSHSISLVGDRP